MQTVTIASILLAATMASACASAGGAKDPCGLIRTADDPFAGPTRGFTIYLDRGHFTGIAMKEAKGSHEMTVLTVKVGDVRVAGNPGDVAEFIVGGQRLTLELQKEARPVANANQMTVFSQWQLVYAPTREQVAQFGAAPLSAMKLTAGSETFQFDQLDDKVKLQLQNSARCLTQ